jgi:hypothetical protein
MHIATAGMMGWGLATTWRSRRYLRLGLIYLGVVLLHGLWNGLAIFTSLSALNLAQAGAQAGALNSAAVMSGITALALSTLAVSLFFVIFGVNRRLAGKQVSAAPVLNTEPPEVPQIL